MTNSTQFKKVESKTQSSVGGFIDKIMTSAVIAHKLHLKTSSYAEHKALDELYKGLPEHADEIAEIYQGYNGKIISDYTSLDQTTFLKMKPLEFAEELLKYIESNRQVLGDISAIQNLVDELVGLVSSVIYKLKFLS